VDESNTLATTKQAAQRAVDAMTCPDGMTRVTWASVHLVLEVIAQSYPKAFPSQARISQRTGIPVRSVQRYIAAAVKADLLVVEADAGAKTSRRSPSKTNRYYVKLAAVSDANLAHDKNMYSYGVHSVTPSPETSSLVPSSCSASGLAAPPPTKPPRSTVVSMRDWDEERSRDVGPPAAPPLRSKHRVRPAASDIVSDIDSKRRKRKRPKAPPPRSRQLAEYFAVIWEQMRQETGRHKNTRGLESIGQAQTYINAHFKERTDLEVRKMMEEFVISVRKRDVMVKEGQSAWMCFTGAWGRDRHVVTSDPYAAYRKENKK
jgi:hypothetical protein